MSHLMRGAYGYGGTRLEHIVVCAPPMHGPPTPLWLKLPVLLLLLAVPVLVSRYVIPTAILLPTRTLIDVSRLTVKQPPIPSKTVEPEPNQISPLERAVEPPPKPENPQKQHTTRIIERRTIPLAQIEVSRPSISHASTANITADIDYQPRVTRERGKVEVEGTSAPTRLRRDSVPGEVHTEKTAISRARGVTITESSSAGDRIAIPRRTTPVAEMSADAGLRRSPAVRNNRTLVPLEESAARFAASKERMNVSGNGGARGDGTSTASIGLDRGVSLMSLEICPSCGQQEEAIKAVLSVVGSRRSCGDEKGEFQFKGTERVSSFNLIIFPTKGRKPSNRCEELENAYICLKTN